MTIKNHEQPILDRPGAGIPFHSRILNQFLLKPLVIRKASWLECENNFIKTNEKFLKTLHDTPQDFLFQKSLVPPQIGLEDSSRYWSMAMTAAHLKIVGEKMQQVIIQLSNGESVNEAVDIAAVKPSDEHNRYQSITEYELFSKNILSLINSSINSETSKQSSKHSHFHPWFGKLRAKDWLWLLGAHTQIHLKQVRNIKSQLQA
ncbi:MAG: hypothetical protein QE271_05875 [Bacteriovoracaceae bacterium]|nr:hypothetical protein [Bacteriovoracaceae bacterium]